MLVGCCTARRLYHGSVTYDEKTLFDEYQFTQRHNHVIAVVITTTAHQRRPQHVNMLRYHHVIRQSHTVVTGCRGAATMPRRNIV